MKLASLFAGIGGWDLAAERLGIETIWQSETDKFASQVLEQHWPGLNRGDIHDIQEPGPVDIVTAGFPCQSYSYAGRRGGLGSDNGALWWETLRVIQDTGTTHFIGENVPGLLSSGRGDDFRVIVDSLVDAGYGVSWRVLDSQWFGVPQRRRRLYIHAHRNPDRRPRPEVLALAEGVSGDHPPSRGAGGLDPRGTEAGARGWQEGRGERWAEASDVMGTLATATASSRHLAHIVTHGAANQRGEVREMDVHGALPTRWSTKQAAFVTQAGLPRRLTPLECERLQGFPDGHTEGCSDTQRYKQLGNSQTVNVATWILGRVLQFEHATRKADHAT